MAATSYAHHFSSKNLPFGIASSPTHEKPQAATRVGDTVIFLNDLAEDGLFSDIEGLPGAVFVIENLNAFAALPRSVHRQVRRVLQALLEDGGFSRLPNRSIDSMSNVSMHLPVRVSDFAGMSPAVPLSCVFSILICCRLFMQSCACSKRWPDRNWQDRCPSRFSPPSDRIPRPRLVDCGLRHVYFSAKRALPNRRYSRVRPFGSRGLRARIRRRRWQAATLGRTTERHRS